MAARPPRYSGGIGPSPGRGPGPSRPSLWHFPGDEVEIEIGFGLGTTPWRSRPLRLSSASGRLNSACSMEHGRPRGRGPDRGPAQRHPARQPGAGLQLRRRTKRLLNGWPSSGAGGPPIATAPPRPGQAVAPRGRLNVRDEGPGFDPATLPDPTDPAQLETPTGEACS